MTAADDLAPAHAFTAALDQLHQARRATPCQAAAARGDVPWVADTAAERSRAATMCAPCDLRALCLAAAVAEGAEDVRGGIDLADARTRAAYRRRHRRQQIGAHT